MKSRLIIFTILLLTILSCVSCDPSQKDIYDNDNKIAEQGDSYYYRNNISNQLFDNKYNMKYGEFSGDDTIWAIKPKKETNMTINYDSKVKSGQFKIVLVNTSKKEVEVISEGEEKGEKEIKLEKEDYRIKIVGKEAKGEVELSIDDNEDLNLKNKD